MKRAFKYIVAIIVFTVMVIIGNWPGSGIKDEWDNLMEWAIGEKRKKS